MRSYGSFDHDNPWGFRRVTGGNMYKSLAVGQPECLRCHSICSDRKSRVAQLYLKVIDEESL
jgi:hypothetical protein